MILDIAAFGAAAKLVGMVFFIAAILMGWTRSKL